MLSDPADDRVRLLRAVLEIAIAAGGVVSDYVQGKQAIEHKADASPVSAADRAAEAVILAGLAHAAPGIPVVAEEEVATGRLPDVDARFFLIDALDGTKEFISGGTDFTVNIALIERGVPTLGVVYAPARSTVYWGDTVAGEAWRATQPPHGERGPAVRIAVRQPTASVCAVASKSHNTPETEAWLRAATIDHRVSIDSSLKFALVAAGEADVYPRAAPTMEWDTAAGDAILRVAGGRVLDLDGRLLVYGKPNFLNPGFLATELYEPPALRPFMRSGEPLEHFK
jgi:3'(2'), 5'-bisphosphate nucleotidase